MISPIAFTSLALMLASSVSAVVTSCSEATSVGVIVDGFNVKSADAYLSAMARREVSALLAVTPSALVEAGMSVKVARAIHDSQDLALRFDEDAASLSSEKLTAALEEHKKLFRENGVKLDYVLFNFSNDDEVNNRLTTVAANAGLIAVAFDINVANLNGQNGDELTTVLKNGLTKVSKKEKKNQGHIVLLNGDAPASASETLKALVDRSKSAHLHLKSFPSCIGGKSEHKKLLKVAAKAVEVETKESIPPAKPVHNGVVVVGAKLSKKQVKAAAKVAAQKKRHHASDSEEVDANEFIPKRFLGQSKQSDEDEKVDPEAKVATDENAASTTLFSSSILSLSVAIGASILAFL